MEHRKTSINKRGTYTYKFADGEKVELFPGAGGIDEEIILTLHRMDDNEISQYYRKGKAPISEAVKEEKTLWLFVVYLKLLFSRMVLYC